MNKIQNSNKNKGTFEKKLLILVKHVPLLVLLVKYLVLHFNGKKIGIAGFSGFTYMIIFVLYATLLLYSLFLSRKIKNTDEEDSAKTKDRFKRELFSSLAVSLIILII